MASTNTQDTPAFGPQERFPHLQPGTAVATEHLRTHGPPQAGFPGGCARTGAHQHGSPELRGRQQEWLQSNSSEASLAPPGPSWHHPLAPASASPQALHPQLLLATCSCARQAPPRLLVFCVCARRAYWPAGRTSSGPKPPGCFLTGPTLLWAPRGLPVACLPLLLDGVMPFCFRAFSLAICRS